MTTKFHKIADQQGIPLRTLAQVQEAVEEAKRDGGEVAMVSILKKFGRMTDEARNWLVREYP